MPISRNELKNVKALQSRKGRRTQRLYLAEGIRLLEEALRFGKIPRRMYFSPSLLSERGHTLLDEYRAAGADTVDIASSDLKRITASETSQGLLGVFALPETDLNELNATGLRKVLMCEHLADPGNVGTMIRTALAFGFDLVLLCGNSADPFSPKVVRSSVGAIFGLPVIAVDIAASLEMLGRHDIPILAAAPLGTADLLNCLNELRHRALALAIGSEAEGLSDIVLEKAYATVRIKHEDKVESLNSAVAGAILMKECYDR